MFGVSGLGLIEVWALVFRFFSFKQGVRDLRMVLFNRKPKTLSQSLSLSPKPVKTGNAV